MPTIGSTHKHYAEAKGYYLEFHSIIYDTFVKFPAMMTDLKNSFTPKWNSENVFGRQDPIITFSNTSREISANFNVPAANRDEAQDNFQQLNSLIKFLYPAFKRRGTSNSISASPLVKIKFANLICSSNGEADGSAKESGLICGISSFDHTFDFGGETPWIDRENVTIPMGFSLSFTGIVLHTHDLGSIGREFSGDPIEFPYKLGAPASQNVNGAPPPRSNIFYGGTGGSNVPPVGLGHTMSGDTSEISGD
jgi:hypothetical protein